MLEPSPETVALIQTALERESKAAQEVIRLREVLAFYADESNYRRSEGNNAFGPKSWANPLIMNDKGKRAREALLD